MFVGEHIVKLDKAYRVLFPSAIKRQLEGKDGNGFVIKQDVFESCLVLYPMEEWERQNSILRQKLNPYNREHSHFLRQFYRGTAEVFMDSSSRLLIPRRLVEAVGAKKELVFAGLDTKIEIWPKEKWNEAEIDDDFGALAEKILGQSENPDNEE